MLNDLALLRSFLAVYRAGAISRAAPALNLSQPAVTAHVQSLERQLGAELFVRVPTRGVVPTHAGETLAFRVAPHLDALADPTLAQPIRTGPSVRLAGPGDVLATLVVPAIAPLVAGGVAIDLGEELVDSLRGIGSVVAGSARRRARLAAASSVARVARAPAGCARIRVKACDGRHAPRYGRQLAPALDPGAHRSPQTGTGTDAARRRAGYASRRHPYPHARHAAPAASATGPAA